MQDGKNIRLFTATHNNWSMTMIWQTEFQPIISCWSVSLATVEPPMREMTVNDHQLRLLIIGIQLQLSISIDSLQIFSLFCFKVFLASDLICPLDGTVLHCFLCISVYTQTRCGILIEFKKQDVGSQSKQTFVSRTNKEYFHVTLEDGLRCQECMYVNKMKLTFKRIVFPCSNVNT